MGAGIVPAAGGSPTVGRREGRATAWMGPAPAGVGWDGRRGEGGGWIQRRGGGGGSVREKVEEMFFSFSFRGSGVLACALI